MQIHLSGKPAEIVKEKVASGLYADAEAFVSDIVLRADELDQLKIERLRREIQMGIDQLNRGEGMPLDMEEIHRTVDEELGHVE